MKRPFASAAILSIGLLAPAAVAAQESPEPPRPYDFVQAVRDATARSDAQRRSGVARQVGLVESMRYLAGGISNAGAEEPWSRPDQRPTPADEGVRLPPLPWLPDLLAGYVDLPRTRQPAGQVQVQTGPHRWESHPIYSHPTRF